MQNFAAARLLSYSLRRLDRAFPLPRTLLPYMDLTYLISGEMTYLYQDEPIHLKGGDAILFPPGTLRERREGSTPVQYASINIAFSGPFIPPVSGQCSGVVTPAVTFQLEQMAELWPLMTEYTERQCLAMSAYLYYSLLAAAVDSTNPEIAAIKRYIADHITDHLTLADIATSVHWTPEYCCARFKKHTGKTVFGYVNEQRILLSKRMILLGETSLHEIASELGFAEYGYFSRVFKKVTGYPPSHYKKP